MCVELYVKCPLVLSHFKQTWGFPDRFLKNTQISNFVKIRPVGAEMFRVEGWTDMTKLTVHPLFFKQTWFFQIDFLKTPKYQIS